MRPGVDNGSRVPIPPPNLLVKRTSENAVLPERQSPGSAGYDLSAAHAAMIPRRGKGLVMTDLIIVVPEGHYGRIAPRSSLAWKHHIDVGAGVIDSDYRVKRWEEGVTIFSFSFSLSLRQGVVGVVLFNHGDQDFHIVVGDRIAQLILERISVFPIVEVLGDLDITVRGTGGFGSTGTN